MPTYQKKILKNSLQCHFFFFDLATLEKFVKLADIGCLEHFTFHFPRVTNAWYHTAIELEDLKKLYGRRTILLTVILLMVSKTVFSEIMHCLCCRGHENLREIKKHKMLIIYYDSRPLAVFLFR